MSRITGSKLFQEGLQAWNERRRSRGPPSPNFCPAGALRGTRTDITPGGLCRRSGAPSRTASTTLLPRTGSILFRLVEMFIHGHPLTHRSPSLHSLPCWSASPSASPFHVYSMSASSMCGPALLPHHRDLRALLLQITQITLSDL